MAARVVGYLCSFEEGAKISFCSTTLSYIFTDAARGFQKETGL